MSTSHWEVTDVGYTIVLDPLQLAVPACGQVRFCDRVDGGSVRIGLISRWLYSVGSVLLAVRYVKWGTHELDNLDIAKGIQADTEVGLT